MEGDEVPKHLTAEDLPKYFPILVNKALQAAQRALPRPDQFPDAQDAMGHAMVALARKLRPGETLANPVAFVVRVAQRRAIDHIRHSEVERLLRETGLLSGSGIDLETAEMGEVVERFRRAVENLTEKQRSCFVWYYRGGMSERDITTVLGIQVGTVKSNLSRASLAIWEELHDGGSA